MSADDEALRFKCPECGASSGVRCVYMTDAFTYRFDTETWKRVREQTQVKGQLTKRPHNKRLKKVWERRHAAEQASWHAKRTHELRDRFAAERVAYAQLVQQEHEQLTAWLRKFGSVLWTT